VEHKALTVKQDTDPLGFTVHRGIRHLRKVCSSHDFGRLTKNKPYLDAEHVPLVAPITEFSPDSEIMEIMCTLVLFRCRPQGFDCV